MKVYQLTIEGFNSDKPIGCIYERGEEKVLATPYGDEPLEWLANRHKKTVDEILIEKSVTGEKLALFNGITLNRMAEFNIAHQIFEKETHLALLEIMSTTRETEYIKMELESLETRLHSQQMDTDQLCVDLLTKQCTSINYANLMENLKLSTPFTVNWCINTIMLYIEISPVDVKHLEELVHCIYTEEPFYMEGGVSVSYHSLTRLLNNQIRLQLQVSLPTGDKPLLENHLQPMTDAIENYLTVHQFTVN